MALIAVFPVGSYVNLLFRPLGCLGPPVGAVIVVTGVHSAVPETDINKNGLNRRFKTDLSFQVIFQNLPLCVFLNNSCIPDQNVTRPMRF